jgi:hypothetical protein
MLFLLKKPLTYPWKNGKILLVTCLVLSVFTQPVTLIPLVKAEGSYELAKSGGYRPYLLFASDSLAFANDPLGGGIAQQATIKVFVKADEQVNVGSSVYQSDSSFNNKDIVYYDPSGNEIGFCDVENPALVTAPDKPLGLIRDINDENHGPENPTVPSTDGYRPCKFIAPTDGVYQIQFHAPLYDISTANANIPPSKLTTDPFPIDSSQGVGVAAWDVTVFHDPDNLDSIRTGRVYANYLPLTTKGNTDEIKSQFFILSKIGHLYHIHLNGIQPKGFIFFANNKGFQDVNGNSILKSVPAASSDTVYFHKPSQADNSDNVTHKIFFNEPATDLPQDEDVPEQLNGNTWLRSTFPDLPEVSNFKFTGQEGTPNQTGTTNPKGGEFSFNASRAGNYVLTIDVNQNGDFGDGSDRILTGTANMGTNSVTWDGLDGQTTPTPLTIGSYNAKLTLSTDEVHSPFFDVESNPNGLIIKRETACPLGEECDVVYYDDVDVGGIKKLDGEPSSSGVHIFNNNFGDNKGIDTWTSITAQAISPLEIKEINLEVTKKHSPDNPFPGGAVTYEIEVKSHDGLFSDVIGIKVEDVVSDGISGVTWTCAVTPVVSGNSCAQSNGTGNIDTTIDLKKGAIATFTLQGIINSSLAVGANIENTVTITTPNDVTNPDGKTESAEDLITLETPPSQPPIANNDNVSTSANTAVTIAVLDNDTDDNNSLDETSVVVTTLPKSGTTQVIDGKIKYIPNTDSSGTDTFDYKVCDTDGLCALAKVTVTVTSPPSPSPPTPPSPPPIIKRPLSITIEGKGTVTSTPGSINCHNGGGICISGFNINTPVTLAAKPDSGWKFKEWQQDCDNNGEVTLDSDKQCEAIFVQLQQLTLTVFITGEGSVTALSPAGGINCGEDCSNEYAETTLVTLKATPAAGWKLEGWRGHCNEQGEVTLLATDKQCRAIFTLETPDDPNSSDPTIPPDDSSSNVAPFKVTVYKTGQGTVISAPSGIDCGETCSASYDGSQGVQLTATPDPGWKLEGWRGHCDENGQVIRNNISYDHAQCRVIFLPDPSSPNQPETDNTPSTSDTDNTTPSTDGNNAQGNNGQSNNDPNKQLVDEDHDGISTSTENAAPNNGDGNNDGIPDSQQNNVISLPINGQYVTVAETNGCVVDQVQAVASDSTTPAAIDLNLSCAQANITTYYHGISDLQNVLHFQSVPNDSNPDTTQWQAMSVTHDTVMIQGQPVAIESFSLSDGGIGDNVAGDGKITHISGRGPLPTSGIQSSTTDSSGEVNSLPNNTTGFVSTIVGQEINYSSQNNTSSNQNTTTNINNTASSTTNSCLLLATTTPSLFESQILQVGETTTLTLDTGPGEFFIQTMPDTTMVSVDGWKSLNSKIELSLTGLSSGDTQMIMTESSSSQQVILHLTVIATSNQVNSVLPLVEQPMTTLQTAVQVGQNIDLVVKGGQGSLSITQMPDSYLVSLTDWQNHTDGTANFTLTGLNTGNTNLVITDETTPPQKTNININVLDKELVREEESVIETLPEGNLEETISCQGDTPGIDLTGHPNQACFIGKIMSWGDLRSGTHQFNSTEAQNTRVTATVHIAPADVGKTAQILLVGQYTDLNGKTTLYIRDDSRDQYGWERWNGEITQIPPSQYYPHLPKIIDIFIYEGDLSTMPGEFIVFVGYQLSDDTIIYNGLKPIRFWVDNN